MGNTSATGGYLSPVSGTAPAEDAALDAILQAAVVAITGLPGDMVRPRWQAIVPQQPEPTADWCAIGITAAAPVDYPAEVMASDGLTAAQQRQEHLRVKASFYGPNAMGNAALLRAGLYISQNRDVLVSNGIDLTDASSIVAAPALINQQWVRRYDLDIRLRRASAIEFPIESLQSAPVSITTDSP